MPISSFSRPGVQVVRSALLVLAVVTLGACHLERSGLGPAFGRVTPVEYCPGDTLTASYDFLVSETCRAGADCTGPNVDVSSAPAIFTTRRLTGFTNSFTFPAPAASRVSFTFQSDRMPVRIPTSRTMPDGVVIDLDRSFTNPAIVGAALFPGNTRMISHDGLCTGPTASYAITELPGPPTTSARIRPTQVCNTSSVATVVTFSGDDASLTWAMPLAIGQCAPLPAAITAGARRVTAFPQTPDPFARCSALDGGTPPQSLRSSVTFACSP